MDLFSFNGRANRVQFWLACVGLSFLQALIIVLGAMAFAGAARGVLTEHQTALAGGVFALVVQLAFLWPVSATAVRRSHDLNLSGWWYGAWQLAGLAATVFVLVMLALGVPEREPLTGAFSTFDMLHNLMALALLGILGVLPGTPGANKYGLPPNSRHENYRSPPID